MRERMVCGGVLGTFALCFLGSVVAVSAQGAAPPPERPLRMGPGQGMGSGQGLGRGMGSGQGQARGMGQAERIDAAELQRLFDAYQVMQAQDALQLDDTQFGQFLPRLKLLQETRRRGEQTRQQIVMELARLTSPASTVDEGVLKERLQALQEVEVRNAAELRRAYDGVDQLLDVRRQARFRVFEQNMERRKLQLMLRARRPDPGRLDSSRLP
jgi:hypothetical protein